MIIKIYQRFLSPLLHHLFVTSPTGCRFSPTCSEYMAGAIRKYGIIAGGLLGLKRLLRCHPFSRSSHLDPIP